MGDRVQNGMFDGPRRLPRSSDLARSTRTSPGTRSPAFTLVEALMAATILAIISASAALPFIAGVQQVQEAARLDEATALGEALMEEILGRPFFTPTDRVPSPGPDTGQTRATFDNIDDFHGYAETPGDLRNFKNLSISATTSGTFWRNVTVEYVTFPGQAAGDTNSFMRVTVRVFDGNAEMVTFVRIACRED